MSASPVPAMAPAMLLKPIQKPNTNMPRSDQIAEPAR